MRFWKGGRWAFITHHGRRKAKRVGDKAAAKAVASKLRERLQSGDLAVFEPARESAPRREPERDEITLRIYAERRLTFHTVNIKPRTAELYEFICQRHLFPTLGDLALKDITPEHARQLLAEKTTSGLRRSWAAGHRRAPPRHPQRRGG